MRTLILVVGILAIVGMVYCQAAEHPGAAMEHPGTSLAVKTSGVISKVDTAKKEVTVKPATGAEKVLVVGEAVITKGKETITIDEIQIGDKVIAELTDEVGGKVVSVEIMEAEEIPVVK